MSTRPLTLLAGLVVLALLALSVLWGSGGLAGVFASSQEKREVAVAPADLIPGESDRETTAPSLAAAEPMGNDDQRVAAGPTKDADAPADDAQAPCVTGIVVDHLGRPVPGMRVWLQQAVLPSTLNLHDIEDIDLFIDFGGRGGGGNMTSEFAQVSDELGHFLFPNCPITEPGSLTWGAEFAWGPRFKKKFEAGETWHELGLPDPRELTSDVILQVRSSQDRSPLIVEDVSLSLVGQPNGTRAPKQGTEPSSLRRGQIEWRLGAGTWQAVVTALDGERRAVTLTVPEAGERYEHEVLLQVWPDAWAQEVEGQLPPTDLPTYDVGRGLATYIGDRKTMTYDAQRWDAHFLQTLRFGAGPVKAASLTLRVKSISGMSTNDGLYLEYEPAPGKAFRWSRAITDLPGVGNWSGGSRATVHLDLARLPTTEGMLSLLEDLEDGMLDIVIQDDTAVLDIDLRIVR
ncbi:MAG: hypothetical protein O2816_05455 [Planctomycetota bacterium]|nr:hypothetical protein [Planctomycetota bacterium]